MSPSLRFLLLAVIAWGGVRAATSGSVPGADLFAMRHKAVVAAPPITPTEFPPIEPVETAAAPVETKAPSPLPTQIAAAASGAIRYVRAVVGMPVAMRRNVVSVYQLPPATPVGAEYRQASAPAPLERPAFFSPVPTLDEWPMSRLASMAIGARRSSAIPIQSTPALPSDKIDRIQVSAWALLRSQSTAVAGSSSLASGGQLGASQAGARLTYNFDRRVAATLRTSSEVGKAMGEVAAGVRVHPVPTIPVWITAERRQRISDGGGRSAFAVFAEGGIWQRPVAWGFLLDGYLQGGMVGLRSRDLFVDGGATLTRPLFGRFSAGFGVWGGAQPGLARIDAGPRISMKLRNNVRLHFDWRQKLAGNAKPGSGPAVTLGADF